MNKNIKKFEEYTQDPLMNDLENIETVDESPEGFNPKEWEIDEVIEVLTEDPAKSEVDRIEDIDEGGGVDEAITFDTQVPKDIERGSYIWITAMIKRKGTNYNDPGRQAVIKLRCVDIYYGLAHLNKVINQ
tara:strand:- start:34083 stop:34475 length:393 start_codon:yes stop_codon:yes gene_type:complete